MAGERLPRQFQRPEDRSAPPRHARRADSARLKAREIVDRGIERGLFGDHVLSRTPEKSMQARLSTDILNKAGLSKFIRTERGRFTLRSKVLTVEQTREGSQGDSPVTQSEYVAERRVLRTPREEVLCAPEDAFKDVLTFQGIDTDAAQILRQLLDERSISYVSRSEAEVRRLQTASHHSDDRLKKRSLWAHCTSGGSRRLPKIR
jgi:hypothetical protein